jgi:succinate dehydrogenase / fumarate reductase iron-sulfur subunit
MSVLDLLHQIHDEQDGTLAYRYSCRGAICGTCSMMINGTARLACKTPVKELLAEGSSIFVEPLTGVPVIKDLVVDEYIFWNKIRRTLPWLARGEDGSDAKLIYEESLNKIHLDQLNRSSDCIKCGCCVAECPSLRVNPDFIGPSACNQMFKHLFDPRDTITDNRLEISAEVGGVYDCDKFSICNKVCPKDCRPMRAITFIQNRLKG